MRRFSLFILLLLLPVIAFAQNIPQPQGWVNDFAGVITPEYKDKISTLIQDLKEKTSSEIAVVTVNSIAPYDEADYAQMLFDRWKPGEKGKDNGVLILLAVKERRWRIATGYGVEGILPDGLCGEIGRNYMVPYFKDGKYSEGLYYGTFEVSAVITRDINKPLNSNTSGFKFNNSKAGLFGQTTFLSIFGLFFFFLWNIPWPIFIGLPATLLFAAAFAQTTPIAGIFPLIGYAGAMFLRYFIWRSTPEDKRGKFWRWLIFGVMALSSGKRGSSSGSWSGGGFGGGGFGGGGFGGGGFGGGSSGGGGSGGGF